MRPLSLSALALLTVILPSCSYFKPKDANAAYDPYGQQQPSASPYGQVPQSNPYGTPPASPYGQASASSANPYTQAPANPNPYGTAGGYEQVQTYPSTPPSYSGGSPSPQTYSSGTGSSSSGGQVTVQPGDNLTKIAKRNNTSISALKSANGLTSDLIRVGQKLNLP